MPIRQQRQSSLQLSLICLVTSLGLSLSASRGLGDDPPSAPALSNAKQAPEAAGKSARRVVKLPGLLIDLKQRCLDLEAVVCIESGYLELVACTKGSKEHESIVAVSARAMHVHTGLLLLGTNNGHPAMRKPIKGDGKTRWVNVPPLGDEIEVYLVLKGKDEKVVERPISDFIAKSRQRLDEVDGKVIAPPQQKEEVGAQASTKRKALRAQLPHTFVFAGSHLRDNGPGPRQYLADVSGNVVSIATFGDEVLCLPFHQTQSDGGLTWHVNDGSLPKVGTKVTLRLRPKRKPKAPTRESHAEAQSRKESE